MNIEPSGVVFTGTCEIQTDRCRAKEPAPVSAVWTSPARRQVDVCTPCLEEQVRLGEWEIRHARISRRTDIAVYSPDHQLQLVVEIAEKLATHATPQQQALRIYHNLCTHAGIPRTPYFLLYLHPGHFYLWTNARAYLPEPTYAIDDESMLKPYLHNAPSSFESNLSDQLKVALERWLKDVAHTRQPLPAWLVESGLRDLLKICFTPMQTALAA